MALNAVRKKQLAAFGRENGLRFSDYDLINRAFIHRSVSNETGCVENNERLEFLGDAVLGVTAATLLYKENKNFREGSLAKLKSAVVSEEVLAAIARQLQLDTLLVLGKGEEATGGRTRKSLLADAMEAVFGAVYLDEGFKAAFDFIARLLEPEIVAARDRGAWTDYKSLLQEYSMRRFREIPDYKQLKKAGPQHESFFWFTVTVDNKTFGPGVGANKKSAEQEAAKIACETLHIHADLARE